MNSSGQYDYEFTSLENKTIGKAALWTKGVGIISFLNAGLQLLEIGEKSLLGIIITMAIYVAIGVAFFKGGVAFQKVVDTEGNDIAHMMEALTKVGSAFMIRIVITVIAVVFVLLAVLFIGSRM